MGSLRHLLRAGAGGKYEKMFTLCYISIIALVLHI